MLKGVNTFTNTIKITNKKHIECIIIFIDSSDRNAIIMNISHEDGCELSIDNSKRKNLSLINSFGCVQEGMIYREGGKY